MPATEHGHEQLHVLWREAREHNVAHAQVATRAQHRGRWLAALAAFLALFSGAAWSKLAGSVLSDQTAALIAAVAAFAAAAVATVVAAMHWDDAKEMAEHVASADEWGELDSKIQLALWRLDQGHDPSDGEMNAVIDARNQARAEEANISDAELKRARVWLRENRPELYAGQSAALALG